MFWQKTLKKSLLYLVTALTVASCTFSEPEKEFTNNSKSHWEQLRSYSDSLRVISSIPSFSHSKLFNDSISLDSLFFLHENSIPLDNYHLSSSLKQIFSSETTLQDVVDVYGVTNLYGDSVFKLHGENFSSYLFDFVTSGGNLSLAEEYLSVTNYSGEILFYHPSQLASLAKLQVSKEILNSYASFNYSDGSPFFKKFGGFDIVDFIELGVTTDFISTVLTKEDFASWPLNVFLSEGGTLTDIEYYSSFAKDGAEILAFYQLGWSVDDLEFSKDTEKPNAVITYPHFTDSETYYADSANFALINELKKYYDILFKVCSTEDELYDALDTVDDISLFVAHGHGTGHSLMLKSSYFPNGDVEKYNLDTSDTEFVNHISNFTEDAIIFLRSCSAGKELGPFLQSYFPSQKVLAPEENYGISNLSITSYVPLNIEITKTEIDYSTNDTLIRDILFKGK